VKQYKKKSALYRKQCWSLKKEKEELAATQEELEKKIDELKEELETCSRSSFSSRRSRSSHGSRPRSASCSDLHLLIDANHEKVCFCLHNLK